MPEVIDILSEAFSKVVYELICRTACDLPDDVIAALEKARSREKQGSTAELILSIYLKNTEMARQNRKPVCQDTGLPAFFVSHPPGISKRQMTQVFHDLLKRATQEQYLRPNAVDPVTGKNSGINVGTGFPGVYFREWDDPAIEISLMLKGGGSENVGRQYSLPYAALDAGRDLEGVRRVVLDAVRRAEGKGCPPGILGVCIGGDRGSGYVEAKRQLLRPVDDMNENSTLAELEDRILTDANRLGIGPQGLGGETTLLGVKIGALHRVPASYFVTIAYMCWEHRRRRLKIQPDGSYSIV